MKAIRHFSIIIALSSSMGLFAANATASTFAASQSSIMIAKNSVNAQQAAKRAQKQHGGRVLSVKLHGDSDTPYYAVKLIKDGKVSIVNIPAN